MEPKVFTFLVPLLRKCLSCALFWRTTCVLVCFSNRNSVLAPSTSLSIDWHNESVKCAKWSVAHLICSQDVICVIYFHTCWPSDRFLH